MNSVHLKNHKHRGLQDGDTNCLYSDHIMTNIKDTIERPVMKGLPVIEGTIKRGR